MDRQERRPRGNPPTVGDLGDRLLGHGSARDGMRGFDSAHRVGTAGGFRQLMERGTNLSFRLGGCVNA